jgi:hypothetical protein
MFFNIFPLPRAYPFDVVPYGQQQYYWPDTTHGPYYGIFPKVGWKKTCLTCTPSVCADVNC